MKKVIITAVMFAVLMVAASMSVSAAETVEWLDMTHNGTDTQLPTQLTITFDKPVTGLTADRFSVYGATRGALTQSESNSNVYYLKISNVTQPNYSTSTTITVYIGSFYIDYLSGYTSFSPSSKNITIEMLKYEDWEFWINTDDTVTLTKYTGYDTDVEIPATIEGRTVTKLEGTFRDYKGLKSVIIPYGIVEIGNSTFSSCTNLTSVTIPNSVTSINYMAFYDCYNLTNVTIPNDVTSIGNYAFSNCWKFTNITIPNSVISIGSNAFSHCTNLTSVILPHNINSMEANTFQGCTKLTEITIPASVTSIGNDAFSGCRNLTAAYFNHLDASTITDFGQNVFYNTAADFKIYYPATATGFTIPTWKGIPAFPTDYIAVTGINLDITERTLHIGDAFTLTATVAPDNATSKAVTWSSSNSSVATVADGVITAVSVGTATITAKTVDGNRTAACTVTVEMTTAEINDIKITVQPRTTARRLLEVFGAGTTIENKDGATLNLADVVGTGAVITLPNGNKLTVVVPGDITGRGEADITDAKVYLESLVGNSSLDEAQASALEDIVEEGDSSIKKLRSFLNFVR